MFDPRGLQVHVTRTQAAVQAPAAFAWADDRALEQATQTECSAFLHPFPSWTIYSIQTPS